MNTEHLTALLARIQSVDNRQVDDLTIEAWEPLLGDLDYSDAVNAVNRHFRETDKWITPSHIRANAKFYAWERQDRARDTAHDPDYEPSPFGHGLECTICGLPKGRHGAKYCTHTFNPESGYCVHCGLRDDQICATCGAASETYNHEAGRWIECDHTARAELARAPITRKQIEYRVNERIRRAYQ